MSTTRKTNNATKNKSTSKTKTCSQKARNCSAKKDA